MEGYWKDPKRTDEAMERHPDEPDIVWMRTGDIGIMDEEGYVRIVGRSKDVIIRGGEYQIHGQSMARIEPRVDTRSFHLTPRHARCLRRLDIMKARTFSRLTSKSKFDLFACQSDTFRALSEASKVGAWRHSSDQSQTDIYVLLHFAIVQTISCVDRMDGIATNAVIAVPDDKYGEVSMKQ